MAFGNLLVVASVAAAVLLLLGFLPRPAVPGPVVESARRLPGVQELLQSATVAICSGATVETLRHAVPSFPTVSEVWLSLLEAYGL